VLAAALVVCLGLGVRLWRSLDGTLVVRAPSHVLLDRHGAFLGELSAPDGALGYWPLPAALPDKLVRATLETEDRRFREHPGIAPSSIARAVWQNLSSGHVVSGASTIAMQVARLQHPRARTLWAKAREAAEALLLVDRHGHDLVLRQYLTLAPYGERVHGAARASQLYFGKPVEDLSWLQATFLAALPQQPVKMSPWTKDGLARAMARTRRILATLEARGVIDAETHRQALVSELGLVKRPERPEAAMHALLAAAPLARRTGAPTIVRTSIDLELQRDAQRQVELTLRRLRGQGAGNAAALVVSPATGEVLAYVGSAGYFEAQDKGAIDYLAARRSPGSALKPFLYALALQDGRLSLATPVPDVPTEFPTALGAWVPENMTHTFLGPMLAREALGNSRNLPALHVLQQVGVDRALEFFGRGGVRRISSDPGEYGLTLALGSLPVTARELAVLYSALANHGVPRPLTFLPVEAVTAAEPLLHPDAADAILHVLADPEARRPGFPPGGPLDFDTPVAIKTGTSQGHRDAWAVAVSHQLLVVGWVGNADWQKMNGVSGAMGAAPLVHQLFERVNAPASVITSPQGWSAVEICPLSGRRPGPLCPHHRTEYFAKGTEPLEACPFHQAVPIDVRTGLRASAACDARYVSRRPLLDLPPEYGSWARAQHLDVAPPGESPLCPSGPPPAPALAITEPRSRTRYLFDPSTPREFSTVRLSARVTPATEDITWLVDGRPVGQVGWPHELRVSLAPGPHEVRAAFSHHAVLSAPVTVVVED